MQNPFGTLAPFDRATGLANVIIDTPAGSRNKYRYDRELRLFQPSHVLAAGLVFPFSFGFIPGTKGGDGDPLDVLVLSEEPFFPGCMVPARLLGVIEAEQTQEGKTNRNDRFLGVPAVSRVYGKMTTLTDLDDRLITEIEHFFISYNEMRGRHFKPVRRLDHGRARQMVLEAASGARRSNSSRSRKKAVGTGKAG